MRITAIGPFLSVAMSIASQAGKVDVIMWEHSLNDDVTISYAQRLMYGEAFLR